MHNDKNLSAELLETFRQHIYSEYGIHYMDSKIDVLRTKLLKIAGLHKLSLDTLLELVLVGEPYATDIFLKEITVGHTFFFREADHFEILVKDIKKRNVQNPSIWSSASSTGEGPYSIVIALLESGIRDFKLLASDINKQSLHRVNQGQYHQSKFHNMSAELCKRYFIPVDEHSYKIRRLLRSYLCIKRLNLLEDLEFEKPFDYIFCRNVMIYFDAPARSKVIRMLAKNLKTGGLFFVGHSEALLDTPSSLVKEGTAHYRKV